MQMKRLFLLLLLAAVFLPSGVVQATPPVTCSGEFAAIYSETRDISFVDGNIIIVQYSEFNNTGCVEGISAGENRIVIHPDGHLTMQGTRTFTGYAILESGERLSGTYIFSQVGWGFINGTFTVRTTILSGTGDLANLRGTGVAVGDTVTNSGTYTNRYHFDP